MNKFYLLFLLLFIVGCNSKPTSALNHFQNDPQSANAIQYTQKGDILYKNEIKTMLFATYLNNISYKYKNKDLNSFIIGIHLVNEDNHNFEEKGYKLTLNNKDILSITDIKTDSSLVKTIPLKNFWGRYYLVQFKNEEKVKKLTLKLSHPIFGQVVLNFQK